MKRNKQKRQKPRRTAPAWGRVKTACIVVLLVFNVLLLAVFGAGRLSSYMISRQTRSHVDTLLAQRGVLCGSSVYSTLTSPPQSYTLRMDSSIQDSFADTMLTGTVRSSAEKGNTTAWTGENGSISWASSGELTGSFSLRTQPVPQDIEDAQELIVRLLEEAGISVSSEQVTAEQTEDAFVVEVEQDINGVELLGCGMTFTIFEGNATTLEGQWCTGEAEELTVRALESYSAQEVILQLIDEQEDIAQIISAQPTYVLSDKSGGRFTAIPCWRFSTDAGDFVMNALTGDVVASAEIDGEEDSDAEASGSTETA